MKSTKSPKPYLESDVPLALSHRGFSLDGLENSVPAFQAAADLGFTYLETDINTTADGVTVVVHDSSLDRTTDKSGEIAQLPFAVVREARIGGIEPIATLEEFVRALPGCRFNIDIKDAGSVDALAEVIEKFGLHERACVASFSEKRRRQVLRKLSKPVASSPGKWLLMFYFLVGPALPSALLSRVMKSVDVLQIPVSFGRLTLITERNIRRAHGLGLKIHVWTINDVPEMHRLYDLGVDGVMSDRADLLAGVMRERGYWN